MADIQSATLILAEGKRKKKKKEEKNTG